MNPLVSIIIVNWNSKDNLKECLNSLKNIKYSNYEIILVDNNSSDGSLDLVAEKFPRVRVVRSDKNLGFAGGNNLGFKDSKGEFILFLNNDTLITKDFLTELILYIRKRTDVGIVQPKILFHRPGTYLHHKVNSVGSFILRSGFLFHLDYGREDIKREIPYEAFSAYGACFLTRRKIIEEIGLFDPDYFAYFEETDFCQRVLLNGYKIMIIPSTFIYHKGAKTAQKLPIAFIQYHSFKNRLFTYLKNLDSKNLVRIFLPHLLVCEIASIMYLFVGKPDYTLAIQRAIFWNIINLKKVISERNKVQKLIRKVKDDEFIPKLTKSVRLSYYYYLSKGGLENYKE